METVSLKMDAKLLQDIDICIKNNRYSTRTEFIREAIRLKLTHLEKEKAIRKLGEFKGSLKGTSKVGDEEGRILAWADIAKKYNIDLD